jgi:2-methylcitrate dehydratase PrpD
MARSRNDGQNLSEAIAGFVANPPSLGADPLDRAKKVVVDTLSANIAGASSDVLPALERYVGAPVAGGYRVLGTPLRTSAENAALANGTMSAALEYDDVLSIMPGHPSAVVMAALCACDEALDAGGTAIIEAYAVGVQAGARIAQAMTLDHYKRGFHATGTIAMFSAVAALARIAGLGKATTQCAIGIAASFSGGLQGNFGTMTKPLHSGWAARNALAAVALARAGLTASPRIFETEGGFFDAYGSPESSLALVQETLANPWIFDEPGVTLKFFPCCYATHRGIDAAHELRKDLDISAEDVERVTCLVPPGGLIPLKFARPTTHFQSLFSMPYALAVTLLDGHPGLRSFAQGRVEAADVAAMLDCIDVSESELCVVKHPNYASMSYGSRGEVSVEIRTRDGRSAKHTVAIAPGHPERTLSWEQSRAKFLDCAGVAGFGDTRAAILFTRLAALEAEPRFGDLVAQFTTA